MGNAFNGAQKQAFVKLLGDHHVVVFRGQKITREDQERVARCLGPVVPACEELDVVSNRSPAHLGTRALGFHTDFSFLEADEAPKKAYK